MNVISSVSLRWQGGRGGILWKVQGIRSYTAIQELRLSVYLRYSPKILKRGRQISKSVQSTENMVSLSQVSGRALRQYSIYCSQNPYCRWGVQLLQARTLMKHSRGSPVDTRSTFSKNRFEKILILTILSILILYLLKGLSPSAAESSAGGDPSRQRLLFGLLSHTRYIVQNVPQ